MFPTLSDFYAMGFYCFEGDCPHEMSPRRLFRDQQSLRQHQKRRHENTKGEETSMGRALKRKRDADAAEEQQKRQRLEEARVAAEAALRTPEPAPVWSCIRHASESALMGSLVIKVPLLEQAIDTGLTRSARKRREPARFRDCVPTSTVPSQLNRQLLAKKQQQEAENTRAATLQLESDLEPLAGERSNNDVSMDLDVPQQITTTADPFGVFRKYSSIPSHNPDDANPFDDMSSASPGMFPARIGSNLNASSIGHNPNPLADSNNPSEDLLLSWWSEGSCDSVASLDRLAKRLTSPYFDPSRLKDFNAVGAIRRFEKRHCSSKPGTTLEPGDSWKVGSVKIRLPCAKFKQREEDAPEFTVGGILYRDAVEVITSELQDPDSFERIHLKPFEEWWKPSESDNPIRVYSDMYTSDVMLEADKKLQDSVKATTSAGPQLETFIVSVGLYSDSTNLTSFSHASLWPMYMYIGNESKYVRAKPTSFSAHHIAYLPTVQGPIVHVSFVRFLTLFSAARLDQGVLLRMLWRVSYS